MGFPPLPQLIDETCERFKNRQQTPQERKIFFKTISYYER